MREGQEPGGTMSHSVRVKAGSVDRTPVVQSSLAPGAARLTKRLCVEKAAGRPARVGGADREADAGRPAVAAQHRGRVLRVVAVRARVAGGGHRQDVVEEGECERARQRGRVRAAPPGKAEVEHVGAAPDRHLDAAQQLARREVAVLGRADREHLRVAGHALAADPVAVDRRDQAGHERAVADRVGHVGALAEGVVGARDAARELRVGDVEAGVHHRDRAARAAAGGEQRLAGADGVVGPGVLDAGEGVDVVERVGGDAQLRVALDVGHALVAGERTGERRAVRARSRPARRSPGSAPAERRAPRARERRRPGSRGSGRRPAPAPGRAPMRPRRRRGRPGASSSGSVLTPPAEAAVARCASASRSGLAAEQAR